MKTIDINAITQYVEEHIAEFHKKRLEAVQTKLNLNDLLTHKNPYLFRAKNVLTAQDVVKGFADAFLQSQEEGLFGGFMEGLAIFVCSQIYVAKKLPKGTGMDLEFEKDGVIYIAQIKAGWNWGNGDQVETFKKKAKIAKELREEETKKNGRCYKWLLFWETKKQISQKRWLLHNLWSSILDVYF